MQPEIPWDRIAYALVTANLRTSGHNPKFDPNTLAHMADLFGKLFIAFEDELKRRYNIVLPRSLSTLITIFEHWAARLHSNTGDYGSGWAMALFKSVGIPRRNTLRELYAAFEDADRHLKDENRRSKGQSNSSSKSNTKTVSQKSTSVSNYAAPAVTRPRHYSSTYGTYGVCFHCKIQCFL